MSQSKDMLDQYLEAETALLRGRSFSWGDRTVTRSNLPEIQAGRREWERRVAAEKRQAHGDHSPVRVSLADFRGGR